MGATANDACPRAARRSVALRRLLLLLLLASQLALALHQLEHRLEPGSLGASDQCTLCHFASRMAGPPTAASVPVPLDSTPAELDGPADQSVLDHASPKGFLTRAPPLLSSA